MTGIGSLMEQDMQLQEFTERILSNAYERFMMNDEEFIENICDDMGISEEEAFMMFNRLGYKEQYIDTERSMWYNRRNKGNKADVKPNINNIKGGQDYG